MACWSLKQFRWHMASPSSCCNISWVALRDLWDLGKCGWPHSSLGILWSTHQTQYWHRNWICINFTKSTGHTLWLHGNLCHPTSVALMGELSTSEQLDSTHKMLEDCTRTNGPWQLDNFYWWVIILGLHCSLFWAALRNLNIWGEQQQISLNCLAVWP